MLVHNSTQAPSFAKHAARAALAPNNNISNIQPPQHQQQKVNSSASKHSTAEIDKIVVSVENATKRLSQVSTNTNSSKRKSKNHVGPWRLGRTLGRGSTGRVRLAKHSETGQLAAVKIVPKSKFQKDGQDGSPYGIEREIIIMKLISHQNIMGLYDVWENKGELYLVLEYVEGGELFDYLIKKGKLPEKEAVHYFRQIISGVSYCHQFNICHRDLKPENLLLDKNMNIKIADFGMAALEVNHKLLETSCGSPHYASPEIVAGKNYHGSPSDVWSCGIILFALLTGHLPFDDENIRKLLMKVQTGRFIMPNYLSSEAKDLIWKMLHVDPNRRISINDILKHPLMTKYETIDITKNNQTQKEKLDDYYNEVQNLQLKREDIDRDIIKSLSILFHGATESTLVPKLLSTSSNPEKIFYYLLYKYKKQHQIKERQEAASHKAKKKQSNGDGMLKKSKSTARVTITNEDGSTVTKTEQVEMPPIPTTPKKRVVKGTGGQIQISASSSYRRGVSFNNKTINTDSMSRSSSKRSIASGAQTTTNMKKHKSLLPPLPDLEIDWLNIGPDSGPSAEFTDLYNEIFNMKSPQKVASPKKKTEQTLEKPPTVRQQSKVETISSGTSTKDSVYTAFSPQESYLMTSSPMPLPRGPPPTRPVPTHMSSVTEAVSATTITEPSKPLPRQLGNFEVTRRNVSTPVPQSKPHTLDPNYKVRSISNESAQVLQRFGVSLKREKKTNSKIYYSKSSTSINLAAILKNDTKPVSTAPPLPEHRVTSSEYPSFDDDSRTSSFNTTHESSFDFELPTKTEVATIVPISNGSNITVCKKLKGRDDSIFADVPAAQQDFLRSSNSSRSVVRHHKKAASSNLAHVMPPSDIRGSLFNNPSDLREDGPVPRLSSFTRPRLSHMHEANDTKSTIMDNSLFADQTDDDMEYEGAKRVTMIFDDFQQWDAQTSTMSEQPQSPSPSPSPVEKLKEQQHKPIKQSPLKQIQENDFKTSPSGTLQKLMDLQPQRVAPSAPERKVSVDSTPVKKSNWFTKFFSMLTNDSTEPKAKKKSDAKVFKCTIPLPVLKKAVKNVLLLKRKEGTLTSITDSGDVIKATVPATFTLGSPLKFQIRFDAESRDITLEKLKGSKKLFKNLTAAMEFVVETETQRFKETELI